jgi:CheY-like chemotaxis protein
VRRILILDDEPAGREAVAMVLADEGDTVLMAPDGRTALDMIDPATALLDHVREQHPTLPVILMSAIDPVRWRGLSPCTGSHCNSPQTV